VLGGEILTDISGAVIAAVSGYAAELMLIVPVAVGVFIVVWGLPKAFRFFRSLAK
jgi:hypothetical protein